MIASSVLLPSSVADGLLRSNLSGGTLTFRRRWGEDFVVCTGAGSPDGEASESTTPFVRQFRNLDPSSGGIWSRIEPRGHELWQTAMNRWQTVPMTELRPLLKVSGYTLSPSWTFALTVAPAEDGTPEVKAWVWNEQHAVPSSLDIYDESMDPFDFLKPGWPVDSLASKMISMIGLGSVGSAALDALLSYGLRRFALVDPQRLQQRNLARHRLDVRDIGRFKVAALKERYTDRYPSAEIEALALDVELSADIVRPLLAESDLVLAAPDGVVPRRVVSHLARRAGTPLVLAAVLDDGAIGDILRLRPDVAVGCLTCQLTSLETAGAMDLEQGLDPGYNEPSADNPMTAVGGDLGLIGSMAAKVAVATLLEAGGAFDQRLLGDHAVVGLRPRSDLAPPFGKDNENDANGPLVVRWRPAAPPLLGCPTCCDA